MQRCMGWEQCANNILVYYEAWTNIFSKGAVMVQTAYVNNSSEFSSV